MEQSSVWGPRRSAVMGGLCVAAAVVSACSTQTDQMTNPAVPGATAGMAAVATAGTGAAVGTAGSAGAAPVAGIGAAGDASFAGMGGGASAGIGAAGASGAGAAGTGSSAGAGGTDAPPLAGMGGGGAPAPHEDLGQGDGQDVITIGDSWMNLIVTGIEQSLATASGRTYRNFAVPGTLVLNEQIPGQYETAKAADPDIKTVVMTGGGNDILTSSCTDDACAPIVDDVAARLTELQMEMGADGVEDVVIIGYTYPADQGKHASLDYSIMLSNMSCLPTSMPRCHYIDSTMLDITLQDGIHPNAAGYDLIGRTVWELMQAEGMRR